MDCDGGRGLRLRRRYRRACSTCTGFRHLGGGPGGWYLVSRVVGVGESVAQVLGCQSGCQPQFGHLYDREGVMRCSLAYM